MIDSIELENFLAFQALELEARPLTLLSGSNSAGKSSLLHALAILRQSDVARTLPSALLLNGELVELGTGRDVLHSEFVELDGIRGPAMRITLTAASEAKQWVADYDAGADVLQLSQAPTEPSSGGLFEAGFQYLKADRIVPAVTYPKSHEAVTVHRSLGANGQHAPNYLRVHGEAGIACDRAARPDTGRSLLEQTNAWLEVLSPGTSLEVVDVEGTDYVRLSFLRAGPQVKTESQRATNVGFGLTFALPVIVACLNAAPASLLLVENPEAHLHPTGQAVLGRLCALAAACGAQVIVETHSDHVLNAVRLAVKRSELASSDVLLHFFTRTEGVLQPELTTLPVAPDGMIPAWPRGFFDQWDQALDELLG
jgi:predicted ATPase